MLAWLALETDSNCFKFSSIGGMTMRAVPLDAHLVTESDALTGGSARPIAILFVFDLFEGFEFLSDHFHVSILSGGNADWLCFWAIRNME
jgi:hypothetical protein